MATINTAAKVPRPNINLLSKNLDIIFFLSSLSCSAIAEFDLASAMMRLRKFILNSSEGSAEFFNLDNCSSGLNCDIYVLLMDTNQFLHCPMISGSGGCFCYAENFS